ncbi:S-adenosyl-L-methionine-dependent methyltransferase [Ascobolus immersus RN42]|uniref:S-adenosyl-L-methionine-dependent methyltransferase n=1 Tax=Ascobolus immersus RN42 TaxID=1160509 RepID=A0A3N4IHL8_ASCIM|nr:S-adenosyl-L-methionine-dependent methyltransferase [Ascobolus immersus RN42]
MIQFMLGDKLFIVPHTKLPVIRRVLDLGMGTGAWSIAVARSYPSCNVTGIELVPHLLPAEEDQPSNLEIQVDDLNNPFTWPVDHFDFIQSRNVLLGISRPWGEYMKDCTRILRAGGWLQFIEFEWCLKTDPPNQIPKGSAIHQWNTYFSEAMEDREKPRNLGEPSRLNHHMQGAGLTDVSQRMLRVPLWPWSSSRITTSSPDSLADSTIVPHENDIADKFSGQVTLSLAHLSQYMITTYCGVSLNEFYILMASVRNEIEQRQYRVYLPL